MRRIIAAAAAGLALAITPACATIASEPASAKAVTIAQADMLFAAADMTPELETALRAAGWGDRLAQVKTHMNESGGGWPKNLADGETRHFQGEAALKLYKAEEIARLSFYDQDAVVLVVRAAANKHMAEGWRPTEDFFLFMAADAVSKAG
jgi:hypothetical protein